MQLTLLAGHQTAPQPSFPQPPMSPGLGWEPQGGDRTLQGTTTSPLKVQPEHGSTASSVRDVLEEGELGRSAQLKGSSQNGPPASPRFQSGGRIRLFPHGPKTLLGLGLTPK